MYPKPAMLLKIQLVLLFLAVLHTGVAQAAVKIDVVFDSVSTDASNNATYRRTRHLTFIVSKDKSVVFKDEGSTRYRHLGEELTQSDLKTGEKYTVVYKIKNGVIEEPSVYPGFILSDRVTTNGTDSCTYSRIFKKKLG